MRAKTYIKLIEPVVCPLCGLTWSDVQTPHSWWLTQDCCYGCQRWPDEEPAVERHDEQLEMFPTAEGRQ